MAISHPAYGSYEDIPPELERIAQEIDSIDESVVINVVGRQMRQENKELFWDRANKIFLGIGVTALGLGIPIDVFDKDLRSIGTLANLAGASVLAALWFSYSPDTHGS